MQKNRIKIKKEKDKVYGLFYSPVGMSSWKLCKLYKTYEQAVKDYNKLFMDNVINNSISIIYEIREVYNAE